LRYDLRVKADDVASTIIPGALTAGQAGSGKNQTLPSQENQGARPGEVSAGAGALPGKKDEAGVAVPPDVRGQSCLIECMYPSWQTGRNFP
jgi:hypothetical protein